VNEPGRIPLAAFIVLSARKNAIPVVGGPSPMTIGFSNEYMTWCDMYTLDGREGAVAWDDVSEIMFRRGRTLFSPAEMAIILKSGEEIVFDNGFPMITWHRIRSRLKSLGSTNLMERLGSRPDPFSLNRLNIGSPWTMISFLVFCLIIMSNWPSWWLVIVASFGIMVVAEGLVHLINRKSPEPYPRIIDRKKTTDTV
jgi:hypothetical protein